jgi:hypothetical protein
MLKSTAVRRYKAFQLYWFGFCAKHIGRQDDPTLAYGKQGCISTTKHDSWIKTFTFKPLFPSGGLDHFFGCEIQSIQIPNKVEMIGGFCFCNCTSLIDVIFESDSNLKEIGYRIFQECPLESVKVPRVVREDLPLGSCQLNVVLKIYVDGWVA